MIHNIERIFACDSDRHRQASHIHRLTATLLSHEQISAFEAELAENGLGRMLKYVCDVLDASAQVACENLVAAAELDFQKLENEQEGLATLEEDPAKADDIRSYVDTQRRKFDALVASLQPSLVSSKLQGVIYQALYSARLEDFLPKVPAGLAAAETESQK